MNNAIEFNISNLTFVWKKKPVVLTSFYILKSFYLQDFEHKCSIKMKLLTISKLINLKTEENLEWKSIKNAAADCTLRILKSF